MKKIQIYNLLFTVMLIAFASSCKKPLDINPLNSVEQDKAFQSSKDIEVALVGSYADMGSRNFYGGRPFVMADFLGSTNTIEWYGTYQDITQTYNKSILKSNSIVNSVWAVGYATINDVNNVIAALDKVDAVKKNKVEGEAKFIRGASYFDLVKVFAKSYNDGSPTTNLGVPIVLTPTKAITEESFVTRATVQAVYQQVIADLTDAELKLPAANGFFATKGAAAAMLARVYLQMGNFSAAANAANRVIIANTYTLSPTYLGAFPVAGSVAGANTTEDIFAIQVNTLTGFNGYNEFYGATIYNGRGDAVIANAWMTNYEVGDDRINSFYISGGDRFTSKYANNFGNVPIIRYAEMFLIRAECNQRLSPAAPIGGQTPSQDLNKIRARVNLAPVIATLANILKERKLELAFEGGFFLHDAKRTQTNIGSIAWNANVLVFPIPQNEMDANKNLKQNAGYIN
jgi:hypothetical protein